MLMGILLGGWEAPPTGFKPVSVRNGQKRDKTVHKRQHSLISGGPQGPAPGRVFQHFQLKTGRKEERLGRNNCSPTVKREERGCSGSPCQAACSRSFLPKPSITVINLLSFFPKRHNVTCSERLRGA